MTTNVRLTAAELERRLQARLRQHVQGQSLSELVSAIAVLADDPLRLQAVVVIERFQVDTFVAGTLQWVARMPHALQQRWLQAFTRTAFLVGSPRRLAQRFAFEHVAADGSLAWLDPRPALQQQTLTRLLKPLRTPQPWATPLAVGAQQVSEPRIELQLVVSDLHLEEILIHLNHLLSEAAIEWGWTPGLGLTLREVSVIDRVEDDSILRIGPDVAAAGSLRAFGAVRGIGLGPALQRAAGLHAALHSQGVT